jgi:group I intron endonuclease
MTCGIYKITSPSGNCYVGQSVNIEKRWMAHRYSVKKERHNRAFTNAVKKYGIDSFVFEILEECSVDELTDREQFWMDKLKPKYCIRVAADSNFGLVHSEETKRKMSEANRGKTPSEEHKRKLRKFSDEQEQEILILRMAGHTLRFISDKFECSIPTIFMIIRRLQTA